MEKTNIHHSLRKYSPPSNPILRTNQTEVWLEVPVLWSPLSMPMWGKPPKGGCLIPPCSHKIYFSCRPWIFCAGYNLLTCPPTHYIPLASIGRLCKGFQPCTHSWAHSLPCTGSWSFCDRVLCNQTSPSSCSEVRGLYYRDSHPGTSAQRVLTSVVGAIIQTFSSGTANKADKVSRIFQ